jgi:hypothetical protein
MDAGRQTTGILQECQPYPLVNNPQKFDEELPIFVERFSKNPYGASTWREPYLEHVVQPMCMAYWAYKDVVWRYNQGMSTTTNTLQLWLERIRADDWKIACRGWVERRLNKRGIKLKGGEV